MWRWFWILLVKWDEDPWRSHELFFSASPRYFTQTTPLQDPPAFLNILRLEARKNIYHNHRLNQLLRRYSSETRGL